MKLIIFFLLVSYTYLITVKCELNEKTSNKKFSPHFRHKVEEIEEKSVSGKLEKDDPRGNLVSFLLKNAKEIFNEITDQTETTLIEAATTVATTHNVETTIDTQNISLAHKSTRLLLTPTLTTSAIKAHRITKLASQLPTHNDEIIYENVSLSTSLDITFGITETINRNNDIISKDLTPVVKTEKKEREIHISSPIRNVLRKFPDTDSDHDPRRSCILCNNAASEDCNSPKNKLITSVMCERDDDMCYSMHTPFGIVDRGCFNTNHNLTIYVCSCNLCNYMSISEMPFSFDNKRDWAENVIEMSRTRRFRKSVFKEMSCLKCEVNTTRDKGDALDSANCLEGNIGNIPVESCKPNEICAVKALRADGYIWRGCIKAPLYNYWWSLCDYDLCNYESIISIYDFI